MRLHLPLTLRRSMLALWLPVLTFAALLPAGAVEKGGYVANEGVYHLDNKGDLDFSNYFVTQYGGVLYNAGTMTLQNNGTVSMTANRVSSSSALGGAVYNSGDLSIRNNGDTVFRRNVEVSNGAYRLRSIYSTGVLELSAAKDKSITFYDSLYAAGTLKLNNGTAGDIIFSGAYTAEDLKSIKGTAGTSRELANSRTSLINAAATLGGGRLVIENGAVVQFNSLELSGRGTTISLNSGTLEMRNGAALTIGSGQTLELGGASSVTAGELNLAEGSTLTFVVTKDNKDAAALTLNGNVTADSVGITVAAKGLSTGSYKLLTVANGGTVKGLDKLGTDPTAQFFWQGNTLYLNFHSSVLSWTAPSGVWVSGGTFGGGVFRAGNEVIFDPATTCTVTIRGGITPADVIVNSGSNVTFNADTAYGASILGTGVLFKRGTGNLTINTANGYSGGTSLEAGTLTAGNAAAFGTGVVYVNNGTTLNLNNKAVANEIYLKGSAAVTNGSAYKGLFMLDGELRSGSLVNVSKQAQLNSGTVNGVLTGPGVVTIVNDVTINSRNTYKGQTYIMGDGTLDLNGSVAGPIVVVGTLNTAPNGLTLAKNQLLTVGIGGAVNGKVTVNTGSSMDIQALNTGKCAITLNGGSLAIAGISGAMLMSGNGVFDIGGQDVNLTAKSTVQTDPHMPVTFRSGSFALSIIKNYAGNLVLEGGTLNTGALTAAAPITVNGPANLKGTAYKGALTINGNLGTGTNFYLGKNATLNSGTVKGVLTGAAGVSVKGEGTLAGKNTYKGTTAVQAGGLLHLTGTVAGNISVSGTLDSSTRTLTPASGKTLTVNDGGWVKGLVNVASGRTLVMKGTESAINTINLNAGTAVFDSTAAVQVLSGTGVFSMNGHAVNLKTKSTVKSAAATPMTLESGSITLTSSKGYAGPITLNGGTLNIGSIALTSPVTVDGTANLIGSAYKGALTVNGTLAGSTNVYLGKTATLNGGTVKGILKGKGGVIVRGESTLANKNTYTGTTNIQSGALLHLTGSVAGNILVNSDATLHNTNSISLTKGKTMKVMDDATVTGGVVVGSGATLAVYGEDSKLGATTINGGTAVLDSTAAAVVGTGTAALTVHGKKLTVKAKSTLKMAADEDITLRSGKLVLNSTSTTYTGDLLAQGGTLDLASRAIKNDVYLGNAALMNGNALRGTLHVQDANSRYSGSLTLTSAQKLDFEAGSKLTVSGTLTLKGGTALTLSGDDWEEGEYTLISCGKLSGKAATAFKVSGADGFDSSIRSSGKNIILTLTTAADPELTAAPELTTACEKTLAEPERTAAAEEQEEETLTATVYEPDTYAAMQELAPTAEALVQSDWALVDTTRAFTGSIRNRSMGTLTQDGKGAIWANAVGSFARHGSVNSHSGSQVNIYGGSIGAERVFGEHHTLGVALGSTHTMVGGTAVGKLRHDATHLAAYGNSRMGSKFSADWAAAFGTAVIRGNMGANRGKWEQNSGELTARVTYTETLSDRTALRTFAGLDYDATGADRVNGYKTGSVQALRGELGVGLTHASENAVLYAEVGMVCDMVRHNPTVESAHFRLQGANPGRMGFRATLGGSIKLNETWSANAAYNIETAADTTQQSVNVGVSRKF